MLLLFCREELAVHDPFPANDFKSNETGKRNRRHKKVYAINSDFPKKHFWTLSICEGEGSLRRFVMTEPHAIAVRKFTEWAGDGFAFVEWAGSDVSVIGQRLCNSSTILLFTITRRNRNSRQLIFQKQPLFSIVKSLEYIEQFHKRHCRF